MGNIGPQFNSPGWKPSSSSARPALPEANQPVHPQTSTTSGSQPALPPSESAFRLALSPLFAFENAISAQQMALLLRNLLKMPKEMVQLMALLASVDGESQQELLKTLLNGDAHISLEDLQRLLLKNMGQGREKLMQLLQSSRMNLTGSGKDMGELLNTFSQLAAQVGNSPAEALQTTINLYLPYYPLQAPQRFSLYFEETPRSGDDESQSGENSCQLVLYIETISLGAFKISIAAQKSIHLQVLIEHDAKAGTVLTELEKQVQTAMRGESVPPPELAFRQRGNPSSPGAGLAADADSSAEAPVEASAIQPEKPSVGIHPSGGVSVAAIHLTYLLIRIILELDIA